MPKPVEKVFDIEIPPKNARRARTKEDCELSLEFLRESEGTPHEWGHAARMRLVRDFENVGCTVNLILREAEKENPND